METTETEDRCGWMREGGDMQCVYPAGHSERVHKWGPMPAWTPVDGEDGSGDEEGLQEMSQVLGDRGCEIQDETELT